MVTFYIVLAIVVLMIERDLKRISNKLENIHDDISNLVDDISDIRNKLDPSDPYDHP